MTPGLDRDELAARLAVGAYAHAHEYASDSRESIADAAVKMADALLSALSPPASVAPAPYVPNAGDVVSLSIDTGCVRTRVAISGEEYVLLLGTASGGTFPFRNFGLSKFTYLRPATPAEREAAGLPATPAPEASHSSPGGGTSQVGGAAERDAGIVTPASSTPAPEAKRPTCGACGCQDKLHDAGPFNARRCNQPGCGCEDFAPTPPAPSREEAYKALLAFAEVHEAMWDSSLLDVDAVLLRHGWYRGESRQNFLNELRTKALALSRPAATKGGA